MRDASRTRTSRHATPNRRRDGLRIRPAVVLVLVGIIVGSIVGAVVVVAALAPPPAEPVATPTAIPSAAAAPTTGLPDGVAAGFLQVAAVNDRLARAAADLEAALAAQRPSAADIGPLFRKIAADARAGQEGSARVGAWPAAGTFPADAAAFYEAVLAVATDGLSAPLSDDAAYATAGRRMLEALDDLPVISEATRQAAARAGVALPSAVPTPRVSPSPEG